jgi:hypothetical protein
MIDSNGQLGTVSSSRRFKVDIQDMGTASSGLMRLRPVTFRYQKPFAGGSKPIQQGHLQAETPVKMLMSLQYGLIAEEVAEVRTGGMPTKQELLDQIADLQDENQQLQDQLDAVPDAVSRREHRK